MSNYRGFEIVTTDSGFGARPEGTDVTIGLEGTLKGHASEQAVKDAIDTAYELYPEALRA